MSNIEKQQYEIHYTPTWKDGEPTVVTVDLEVSLDWEQGSVHRYGAHADRWGMCWAANPAVAVLRVACHAVKRYEITHFTVARSDVPEAISLLSAVDVGAYMLRWTDAAGTVREEPVTVDCDRYPSGRNYQCADLGVRQSYDCGSAFVALYAVVCERLYRENVASFEVVRA